MSSTAPFRGATVPFSFSGGAAAAQDMDGQAPRWGGGGLTGSAAGVWRPHRELKLGSDEIDLVRLEGALNLLHQAVEADKSWMPKAFGTLKVSLGRRPASLVCGTHQRAPFHRSLAARACAGGDA